MNWWLQSGCTSAVAQETQHISAVFDLENRWLGREDSNLGSGPERCGGESGTLSVRASLIFCTRQALDWVSP
jgi:hypothetical protein